MALFSKLFGGKDKPEQQGSLYDNEGEQTTITIDEEQPEPVYFVNPEASGYASIEEQQISYGSLITNGYSPAEDSLLDLGSGRGELFSYIPSLFGVFPRAYSAVDKNADEIEIGEKNAREVYGDWADYAQWLAEDMLSFLRDYLPEHNPNASFDWIVACNALNEAVFDPNENTEPSARSIAQTMYLQTLLGYIYRYANRGFALSFYCEPTIKNGLVENTKYWSWDKATLMTIFDQLFAGSFIVRNDYFPNNVTFVVYKDRGAR